MFCVHCHHDKSKVIYLEKDDKYKIVRRRRECLNCGLRMTTIEQIKETKPIKETTFSIKLANKMKEAGF